MPDVEDLSTLDHLYVTRFGNFDVVPEIGGTYDTLRGRASLRSCEGFDVWLAHIDEILARLTVPRREKDIPRVAALRVLRNLMLIRNSDESGEQRWYFDAGETFPTFRIIRDDCEIEG